MAKKEIKVSPEVQKVLDIIKKVESNPRDASYGKKEIILYYDPSDEAQDYLIQKLGYAIESCTDEVGRHYLIVSWE